MKHLIILTIAFIIGFLVFDHKSNTERVVQSIENKPYQIFTENDHMYIENKTTQQDLKKLEFIKNTENISKSSKFNLNNYFSLPKAQRDFTKLDLK